MDWTFPPFCCITTAASTRAIYPKAAGMSTIAKPAAPSSSVMTAAYRSSARQAIVQDATNATLHCPQSIDIPQKVTGNRPVCGKSQTRERIIIQTEKKYALSLAEQIMKKAIRMKKKKHITPFDSRPLDNGGICAGCKATARIARNLTIDEVVVTGTRNETDIRHLPMTISVVNRKVLERRFQPSVLPALTEQVPGLFAKAAASWDSGPRSSRRNEPARHRRQPYGWFAGAD